MSPQFFDLLCFVDLREQTFELLELLLLGELGRGRLRKEIGGEQLARARAAKWVCVVYSRRDDAGAQESKAILALAAFQERVDLRGRQLAGSAFGESEIVSADAPELEPVSADRFAVVGAGDPGGFASSAIASSRFFRMSSACSFGR